MFGKKPFITYRLKGLSISIWKEIEDNHERFSLKFTKSYRKNDTWCSSSIFLFPEELCAAIPLLTLATKAILKTEKN